MVVGRQINKPTRRLLLTAEVTAGETAVVGITFNVEYGQVFLLNGVLADISLGNDTDIGIGNNLTVYGAQGGELTESLLTVAQAAAVGNRIFFADEFFSTKSFQAKHYFGVPQKYYNQGAYSFFISFIPDNAILPFAGNALCTLTVFGEVVNKEEREFPYQFRA